MIVQQNQRNCGSLKSVKETGCDVQRLPWFWTVIIVFAPPQEVGVVDVIFVDLTSSNEVDQRKNVVENQILPS